MSLGTRLLPKSYEAEAAIVKFRFVKPGATDKQKVIQGAAATDDVIGISQGTRSAADVTAGKTNLAIDLVGESDLEVGAVVVQGALLVSDANGKGITAAPATGVNNRYGAMALEAGSADGAVIRVLVLQGSIQGA